MWKIVFTYRDNSEMIVRGKSKRIAREQAIKYHNMYGWNAITADYYQSPYKDWIPMQLWDVIRQLGRWSDD